MKPAIIQYQGKVLVIDEDPVAREVYASMTAGWRGTLDWATSGEEGLAKHKAHEYDLILFELDQPGMSGIRFLIEIQRQRTKKPALFVVAAESTVEMVVEVMRLGANGFIEKPIRPEHLASQVNRILRLRDDPMLTFIRENHSSIRSREDVALHFGVCARTVLNHVKESTKQSYHDFLQHCRIEEAQKLLVGTELCIKQIAGRVGFSSPQGLARTFRRKTSRSPLEYRREIRLNQE